MELKEIEEYVELEKQELELAGKKKELLEANQIFKQIKLIEEDIKAITIKKDEMKEVIKESMEKHDVKKFENDILTITYIAPFTRVDIDKDKLKEQYEVVYLDCLKETPVKSSVRIKVKE